MFKAKRIDTGEIETIVAVDYFDPWHQTYFLTWSNDAWRWRPAHKYVPPNVNPYDVAPINVRTSIQSGDIIDDNPPLSKKYQSVKDVPSVPLPPMPVE